ncbi:MAG: putative bifunctional diguanylate cyclase/phosphodiesterase [Hyphomicrobiaceae bacterium]
MRLLFDRCRQWAVIAFFDDIARRLRARIGGRGAVPPRRGAGIASWLAAMLAIGLICAAALTTILGQLHDDALTRSHRESAEFASVLAGQTSRSVEAISLVLDELVQHVSSRLGRDDDAFDRFGDQETHLYLKNRLARLPFADVVTIVGPSGRVASITRAWPTPVIDLSDRDYFIAAQSGQKDLHISAPLANKVTGTTVVYFARRIDTPSGTFGGVVLVGARPNSLIDAHATDAHVEGRSLVLARRDGVVLAHSLAPQAVGTKFPARAPWYRLVAAGGGDYRTPGYFDGVTRLVVVRPLKIWPLVVNVAQAEDAALATWYETRKTLVLGGSAAGALAVGLTLLLLRNVRKLTQAQTGLWKQAHEDALTELPNRRLLADHLDRLLQAPQELPRAVLFIDLDRFKNVNDSLGHAFGDELLQQVATRLRLHLRQGDLLARIGGDEFVMVLAEVVDARSASNFAEMIIGELEQPFNLGGRHRAHIGASVGIRLFSQGAEHSEQLIDEADLALYQAKMAGRGRACFYQPEMKAVARQKLTMDARMRRALELGEFGLVYQPIVAMEDRRIIGVEALVRWNDPSRGVVSPGEFIALAEETGFIDPLSQWILVEACRQMADWRAESLYLDAMSINLSFRHFQREGLIEQMQLLLSNHDIPAQCITLEITESMVMRDEREINIRLSELCGLGFSISLDDFGTGYSCLSVLRHLPIHKLKIDRSFLRDMPYDPIANNVAAGIIGLAKSLGLQIVAEGIEKEGQYELLKALGCDFGQGYLLGRPMPAAELAAAVRAQQGLLEKVA